MSVDRCCLWILACIPKKIIRFLCLDKIVFKTNSLAVYTLKFDSIINTSGLYSFAEIPLGLHRSSLWQATEEKMGGDAKLLDTTQVINGLAVLLSFYVGYKYAIKKHITEVGDEKQTTKSEASTSEGLSFSDYSSSYKMVLVVRNDLKMGKGKIAAQCGHGAVAAYQKSMRVKPNLVRLWENTGCAKIALKVESESEMMAIRKAAEANGLITCTIRDAGRTQIEPNSKTVLAIGPAAVSNIDNVTGHLKLL